MSKSAVMTREKLPAHLDDLAICIYQYAAVRHGFSPVDVAIHCGVSEVTAEEAIDRLITFRLLEPVGDGEYVAVPPGTAAVQLLGPTEQELRSMQRELEQKRIMLDSLVPVYEASVVRRRLPGAVEPLRDVDTVRNVHTELAATCRYEMLAAQPGGGLDDSARADAWDRDKQLLARGVRVRTLFQQSALFHQPTTAYVESVTPLGAQVRTVSGGLLGMIVFDREHLLVPLRDQPDGVALVRDPSCIDLAVAAFDLLWLAARPFVANVARDELRLLSNGTKKALLRMLIEGATDQAAARRLGISVRTCQRHIAEVMDRLDAKNRMQLGFLTHQRRLLEDPGDLEEAELLAELPSRPPRRGGIAS